VTAERPNAHDLAACCSTEVPQPHLAAAARLRPRRRSTGSGAALQDAPHRRSAAEAAPHQQRPPRRCPGTANANVRGTWRKTLPAFPKHGRSHETVQRANHDVPGDVLAFRGLLPARIRSPVDGGLGQQQARSSPGLVPSRVFSLITLAPLSYRASPHGLARIGHEDLCADPPGYRP
jgi:hypothetical protein